MDWDKLRIFHAVAEAGSFTRAGETLHLSQSAVSRQVSALEESLQVALFHRHARGLLLTEQGELLFQTAHEVFAKLAMTEAQLMDAHEKPSGELRVTATVGLGANWLTPRIREFIELYPEITVNLILADRELDLGMREADIAIRLRAPVQPDLIQRKLMTVNHHVYASPSYLKKHGTPTRLEDILESNLITYGDEAPTNIANLNWLLKDLIKAGRTKEPVFKVNNVYGLLLAVQSGLGIASLPDYIVDGHTNIIRILPELGGPTFDTYYVYPEELRKSKRVTIFRDFLIQKIKEYAF
ncbi:LysR family transcriptional regulator [Sneathiella sp. HT1-7]|jgi:DNA-binding transcriptional LysR family regulator|uniref:LysR family transcriptional regulator n=1 Tax=Sneathiella sp. HT1-7 TaxID=2887192 RepID=UPI001D134857|nr:LysR family transcriptional regulator [Sneathiella sp. HT1-7]MCC3306713.1 LysR family transcriptional regulator [Sneathiella sp. HT1-7]